MHESSYISMQRFYNKYVADTTQKVSVLDVGSQLIDGQQGLGSYKNIFEGNELVEYVGCDMVEGLNVDILLADPYNWSNIEENSFDFVITGQMLEHVEYPWHTLIEINRVLKPGGICCVIAPSAGAMHNYPLDCFRYYPDGMAALAKYAGLEVIESYAQWEQEKYPYLDNMWHDCVLIARKKQQDNSDEASRRKILYNASADHIKNDSFVSMNPVLDFSLWMSAKSFFCKIYLDTGKGLSENETVLRDCSLEDDGHIILKYTDFPSGLKGFRLDPCDQSCMVGNLRVRLNGSNVSPDSSNAEKVIINNNEPLYIFMNDDPQLYFNIPEGETIAEAEIEFDIAMVPAGIAANI